MKHQNIFHDGALLVVRVAVGASIAAHGTQKLFGWFGGPGIENAATMFGNLGFRPPRAMARMASLAEVASGLLIASGAGGPLGPMMLAGVMTAAAGGVHLKNGFFAQNQGFEINAMYALLALLLAVEDHGRFSVDSMSGLRNRMHPALGWLAFAGGVGAAVAILARREQPASRSEMGTAGAPAQNAVPAVS